MTAPTPTAHPLQLAHLSLPFTRPTPYIFPRPHTAPMLAAHKHGVHQRVARHLSVAVDVSLPDHLVNLLVGKLLTEVGHHVSQFCSRDEPVTVLVEHLHVKTRTPIRTNAHKVRSDALPTKAMVRPHTRVREPLRAIDSQFHPCAKFLSPFVVPTRTMPRRAEAFHAFTCTTGIQTRARYSP